MTSTQNEAPESIMRRVQALLELAAHPSTPQAERETSQEMADKLMARYRLDRAMLNFKSAGKVQERREPTHRFYDHIKLVDDSMNHSTRDWNEEYGIQSVVNNMRDTIYRHAGCEYAFSGSGMTYVGYEEDLFFGDMLWSTVFQDVVTRMFPRWEREANFDENVFRLKNAGFSWPQVREAGLAVDARDRNGPLTAQNAGSKLRTAYNRYCKKVGYEPPETQPRNPGLWRRSFVDSYSSRLRQRMAKLKNNAEQEAGEEGALALIKDSDLVRQKLYDLFPSMNPANWPKHEVDSNAPKPKARRPKKIKYRAADPAAWDAGYHAANRVDLGNVKAAGHKKEELG